METPLDQLNWYALPVQIQDIAKRCGKDVAADVLRHFAGMRIRVPLPKTIEEMEFGHPLKILGDDAVLLLARTYPGQYLHIPRAYHAFLRLRNDVIISQRRNGESASNLARNWRLTERQIWNIVGHLPDTRQTSLFE